jgi:hypothetical protein
MWLSTTWVMFSIVLAVDGHPETAVVPLCFWLLHRRWERRHVVTR